jgi:hypothetical protein
VPTERLTRRAAALQAAATLPYGHGSPRQIARLVTDIADHFEAWLAKPAPIATVEIVAGVPESRRSSLVSLIMPDDDMVTLSVAAMDAQKVIVPDDFTDTAGQYVAPFTWTEDNTAVGELAVAADTLSANLRSFPGQAGTVVVNITDANGKALPPFTVEIDPGTVATVGVVAAQPVPRDDTAASAV